MKRAVIMCVLEKVLSGNTVMVIGIIMIIGGGLAVALTKDQAPEQLFRIIMDIGVSLIAVRLFIMPVLPEILQGVSE
jgi:hypothetical protein